MDGFYLDENQNMVNDGMIKQEFKGDNKEARS